MVEETRKKKVLFDTLRGTMTQFILNVTAKGKKIKRYRGTETNTIIGKI